VECCSTVDLPFLGLHLWGFLCSGGTVGWEPSQQERGLVPLETDPEAGKQGVGEEVRRAGVGEHRGLHGHSCRVSRVKSEGPG
jgi:hypothetical protein